MKRCPTCDKRYEDSLSFCQSDGAMLIDAPDSVSAGMWRDESAEPIAPPVEQVERPSVTFGAQSGTSTPGSQWTPTPTPGAWMEGHTSAPGMQIPIPVVQDKSLATWSMVLGVLGIACCGIFTAIPAIVLGVMAKNKISQQPNLYGGGGLATAGIVLGIIGTIFSIVAAIVQVALLFNGSSNF